MDAKVRMDAKLVSKTALKAQLKHLLSDDLKLRLSALWRRLMFRTTVIAITGSMGKTTVKELLSMALASQGKTLKTNRNQNHPEGVARTLRSIRPWHRYAVIEIGTDEVGMMQRSAELVRPDIAIVLCVAATHQNNFKNLDNTAEEKSQLVRALKPKGIAILNGDDARVRSMADICMGEVFYFGVAGPDAADEIDFVASNPRSGWPKGLSFDFATRKEKTRISTKLIGAHWLDSVNAAMAAATVCQVPLADSTAMIEQTQPYTARMQPVSVPCGATIIRDDMHASTTAFDAMFQELIGASATRKGLVIGDHTDSKKSPKQRFRRLGKKAADHCDFVVFVGDHSHHGHNAAVSAGMDPGLCPAIFGIEQAADWLKSQLRDGDLVFIKGRLTDHLTRIAFSQFGEIGCWKSTCHYQHSCDVCNQLKPQFDLSSILPAVNSHSNLIAGNGGGVVGQGFI